MEYESIIMIQRSSTFVSIIIIEKNQKKFLEKSLPIIFEQTYRNFEVILVDSGSTDKTLEYIKRFPIKLVYTNQPNPITFNFARAFNDGAEVTNGSILVRLSGDAIPVDSHWLSSLIQHFSDDMVGATIGRCWFYPWDTISNKIMFLIEGLLPNLIFLSKNPIVFTKGNFSVGSTIALRKTLWQKYRFDEDFPVGEDCFFMSTIHKAGFRSVFEPRAMVYHNHGVSIQRKIFMIRNLIKVRKLIKEKKGD